MLIACENLFNFDLWNNCNIEMDLGDIGWGGVDWIRLAQDRN
jgi:hypothetical protein